MEVSSPAPAAAAGPQPQPGGPAAAAGLSELAAAREAGPTLVTQASLRAAEAAAAAAAAAGQRPVPRQLSGAVSLTPRLRSALQSEQLDTWPEQVPGQEPASSRRQSGQQLGPVPELATASAEQQPAEAPAEYQVPELTSFAGGSQPPESAAEPPAGSLTDRSAASGSMTARTQALQRLKERNLSRALQSGALSARWACALSCAARMLMPSPCLVSAWCCRSQADSLQACTRHLPMHAGQWRAAAGP